MVQTKKCDASPCFGSTSRSGKMSCVRCQKSFHLKCAGLTTNQFKSIRDCPGAVWLCLICRNTPDLDQAASSFSYSLILERLSSVIRLVGRQIDVTRSLCRAFGQNPPHPNDFSNLPDHRAANETQNRNFEEAINNLQFDYTNEFSNIVSPTVDPENHKKSTSKSPKNDQEGIVDVPSTTPVSTNTIVRSFVDTRSSSITSPGVTAQQVNTQSATDPSNHIVPHSATNAVLISPTATSNSSANAVITAPPATTTADHAINTATASANAAASTANTTAVNSVTAPSTSNTTVYNNLQHPVAAAANTSSSKNALTQTAAPLAVNIATDNATATINTATSSAIATASLARKTSNSRNASTQTAAHSRNLVAPTYTTINTDEQATPQSTSNFLPALSRYSSSSVSGTTPTLAIASSSSLASKSMQGNSDNWYYITKFLPSESEQNIVAYVSKKARCSPTEICCSKLVRQGGTQPMTFVSFKISVPRVVEGTITAEHFWPEGITISPFLERRSHVHKRKKPLSPRPLMGVPPFHPQQAQRPRLKLPMYVPPPPPPSSHRPYPRLPNNNLNQLRTLPAPASRIQTSFV